MKYNNPFFQTIWDRLHKRNKNALILVHGETGSGKSYLGLKICYDIDPEFNITRVIHDPEEFFELLRGGTLKKGSAILFDEIGTTLTARRWYSFNNFIINNVLQTFRYRNLLVVFTVPSITFVDKNARKLIHYDIETLSIDEHDRMNIVKIARLKWSDRTDKFYRTFFRLNKKTIMKWRIKIVGNRQLIKNYEAKALDFKSKVEEAGLAGILREKRADKVLDRKEREGKKRKEVVEKICVDPQKYMKINMRKGVPKESLDRNFIEAEFNLTERESRRVVAVCNRKIFKDKIDR